MRWPTVPPTHPSVIASVTHRLRRRLRRYEQSLRAPFAIITLLLGAALTARATTVTPPSFTELVGEAEVAARGTVTGIESRWVAGAEGPVIKTFVTFAVERVLKGNPASTVTLEFLGGTVGGDRLQVTGMPSFQVGDTEILFITHNGLQFCPLVRFAHGRYRVRTDPASHRQFVARDDQSPLESVDDVGQPQHGDTVAQPSARPLDHALSPEEFEAQVSAQVVRESTRDRLR